MDRYCWTLITDDIRQSVDAAYQMCKNNGSAGECKEVITMLEQSANGFKSLLEHQRVTRDGAKEDKPTSSVSGTRKMSPEKNTASVSPGHGHRRTFSEEMAHAEDQPSSSWADRVRVAQGPLSPRILSHNYAASSRQAEPIAHGSEAHAASKRRGHLRAKDESGWVVVQRTNKCKSRQSVSQKSLKNLPEASPDGKYQITRSMSEPDSFSVPPRDKPTSAYNNQQRNVKRTARTVAQQQHSPKREHVDSKGREREKLNMFQQPAVTAEVKRNVPVEIVERDVVGTKAIGQVGAGGKEVEGGDCENIAEEQTTKEVKQAEVETGRPHDEENLAAVVLAEQTDQSTDLEVQQKGALASAVQQEETSLQAMVEGHSSSNDVPTDTDNELQTTDNVIEDPIPLTDWDLMLAAHEAEQAARGETSWERMSEEAGIRSPNYTEYFHEKFSTPSIVSSPNEFLRRHEENQAKPQELREKKHLRKLSKTVEDVHAIKEDLVYQTGPIMAQNLQLAEEKCVFNLTETPEQTHEESAKANEIGFVNTMEALNNPLGVLISQESEARPQDQIEEQQRMHEENQAKETAVEKERRGDHEAERWTKLQEMHEKKKKRDKRERIATLSAQQHKVKVETEIQQKQLETTQRHEECLRQIKEKAFAMCILRHSTEDLNDIPDPTYYDKSKLCIICDTLIPTEVHLVCHLRGKKHLQALQDNFSCSTVSREEIENFNFKHIVDIPDNCNHPKIVAEIERQNSMKRRCKRLRSRMKARGAEYEASLSDKQPIEESEDKAKLQKLVKDLNRCLQSRDSGPWSQNRVSAVDRALREIARVLRKKIVADQNNFRVFGGLGCLHQLLRIIEDATPAMPSVIPPKSLSLACDVYWLACVGNIASCRYTLYMNNTGVLTDYLINRLSEIIHTDQAGKYSSGSSGDPKVGLPYDCVASSLMSVLAVVLSCLAKHHPASNISRANFDRMGATADPMTCRSNDVIGHIISAGVLDKMRWYFRMLRGPVDGDTNAQEFLQRAMGLLMAMTKFVFKRKGSIFDKKKLDDPTQLILTFEATEMAGIVTLLFCMLMHLDVLSRGPTAQPELSAQSMAITMSALRMLNRMAILDLASWQQTLGEEGTYLEFRHIAGYLIWYSGRYLYEELLHEIVLCVGYFTVLHTDNQNVLMACQSPSVLEQICTLPFLYFTDPRQSTVLFPTILSCCFENPFNRFIFEQELGCVLLSSFIEQTICEQEQKKLVPCTSKQSEARERRPEFHNDSPDTDSRMSMVHRFPQELWPAAQQYFNVTCEADDETCEPDDVTCEADDVTCEPDEETCEPDEETCEPDDDTCEPDDETCEPDDETCESDMTREPDMPEQDGV